MTEEQMMAQLRGLLDGLPGDGVVRSLKNLWDLRCIGEEIAPMVFDSFEQLPAGVRRGATLERDLGFEFDDLELTLRFDGPDLLGETIGEAILSASLIGVNGEQTLDIDAFGGFIIERPRDTVLRVALVTDTGRKLSTEWMKV